LEEAFQLGRGTDLVAIDAKSGRTFADAWCKGLRAISPLKELKRRIIVYPSGPAMRTQDGIEAFPFAEFAEILAADTLWG
jgi:hypothetical protein